MKILAIEKETGNEFYPTGISFIRGFVMKPYEDDPTECDRLAFDKVNLYVDINNKRTELTFQPYK